ncbi:hypothetical protein PAEPH01_0334 [Pancytospora epiphaga]|nr:hypothetical protein PAEPH01_0334 [Pancytospora epiphaga]
MFRGNGNNDEYKRPHDKRFYNYSNPTEKSTESNLGHGAFSRPYESYRVGVEGMPFPNNSKFRMPEVENDWAIPVTVIDSLPVYLLDELKELAKQEAKNFVFESKRKSEEVVFNPPNFTSKSSFEHLLEVASLEANKLSILRNSVYTNPQRVTVPILNENISSPRKKERRLSSDSAYDVSSSTIGQRSGPVRSFNDFDEGIFEFDKESGMYSCPYPKCPKNFPSLSRIKRHYIIHTNIKPFKCPNKDCPRTFSRKDNMLQHYRVHCPYSENS